MPLATSLTYFGIKFPLFPLRISHKGKNKGKYISFHYLRGWKACKIRKVQEISPQIPICFSLDFILYTKIVNISTRRLLTSILRKIGGFFSFRKNFFKKFFQEIFSKVAILGVHFIHLCPNEWRDSFRIAKPEAFSLENWISHSLRLYFWW